MTTDLSKYDASALPAPEVLALQRYAIVVADWNPQVTYAMAQGAVDTFIKHGVREENILIQLVTRHSDRRLATNNKAILTMGQMFCA